MLSSYAPTVGAEALGVNLGSIPVRTEKCGESACPESCPETFSGVANENSKSARYAAVSVACSGAETNSAESVNVISGLSQFASAAGHSVTVAVTAAERGAVIASPSGNVKAPLAGSKSKSEDSTSAKESE